MLRTPIGRLRAIGCIEGVSFLVLLGVAMPLKYFAGLPMAVKVVGWIHGILFILFCVALAQVQRFVGWQISRSATVFMAALMPFGPFLIDASLKKEDESLNFAVAEFK